MYFVNTKFMWKIAIIGLGLMLTGLGSVLVGCGAPTSAENVRDNNTWLAHGRYAMTKVVEIEGHKYIIFDAYKGGGIIHAESCSCKK